LYQLSDSDRGRSDIKEFTRSNTTQRPLLTVSYIPGFDPHLLHGKPSRYAIKVNGPWRITFEWIDGDAWRVDLEQYH